MSRVIKISATLLIISALVGGMIAIADPAKQPPTELYVRTVPAGAEVSIDGKQIGKSDDLFEVEPGVRKVEVELDGYEPASKEVIIPATRIERVVLELKKRAEGGNVVASNDTTIINHKSAFINVLRRARLEYDATVRAYEKKDWPAVDRHSNELSDLIRDEIMGGFKLPFLQLKLKEMKPGQDKKSREQALVYLRRMQSEMKTLFSDEKELKRIRDLLQSVEDFSDDLHDSIRDGKTEQVPARYESLKKAWEAMWKHATTNVPGVLQGDNQTLNGGKPIENILSNPGAEDGENEPDAWKQGAAIPGVKYSWDKKVAFEGKASLCIEKTAQRYFPIASWSQKVPRKGNAPALQLSAQVKAEKMTKAILDVVFLDKNDKWISHKWAAFIGIKVEGQPPANHDWKKYAGTVEIPPGTVAFVIGLQVYGPGKVWFDDVRVEEVNDETKLAMQLERVAVDTKLGCHEEPMFGQGAYAVILYATANRDIRANELLLFLSDGVYLPKGSPSLLPPKLAPGSEAGWYFRPNQDISVGEKFVVVCIQDAPEEIENLKKGAMPDSDRARDPNRPYRTQILIRDRGGKRGYFPSKDDYTFREAYQPMMKLVSDFFRHNFRDVTSRQGIEWADFKKHPNGNRSIRYKYLATIWGKDKLIMNQVFTFDADGKFVKYENVKRFPRKGGKPASSSSAKDEDIQRRVVGKKVADFPEAVDLSTPESAWAAYQRANIRKDGKAVAELSWVKIDQAREEQFWKNANPEDLAIYIKALQDSVCVEVLTYREDLAAVISRLPFPPGKGRHPYSIRSFGLIDGEWKNKGEDRCPSLEAARAGFEKKKDVIWKAKPGIGTCRSSEYFDSTNTIEIYNGLLIHFSHNNTAQSDPQYCANTSAS